MIELRWLERWVERQGVGESPKNVEERVLQYRQPVQWVNSEGYGCSDWSEWQDVPVEREE